MQKTERHVNHWNLQVHRQYVPYYFLGSRDRYDAEPEPSVGVVVSAEFDSDESALAFERTVRELLEKS